jgi:hypothetical protein
MLRQPIFPILFACVSLFGCEKQATAQPSATDGAQMSSAVTPKIKAAKTYNGPFGLAAGMSIAELQRLGFKADPKRPQFFSGKPPKPLEDANQYIVMATPAAGVCRILASINVPVVNGSGDQLKARTDRMAEAMQVKYGKYSDKIDDIDQDVYRRNPSYWMLGLKEDSVLYGYVWGNNDTEKPLPVDLKSIQITAETTNTLSGYVSIKYTFMNVDSCIDEVDARKANNL